MDERLLSGRTVDLLTEQVGVAVVPRIFLNHVAHDPTQAGRSPVRPGTLGESAHATVSQRLVNGGACAGHRALPESQKLFRCVLGPGTPLPVRIGVPVGYLDAPSADASWSFQLMLVDTDWPGWLYRRDQRIRRRLAEIGLRDAAGRPILAPEIQLLYKSNSTRRCRRLGQGGRRSYGRRC